MAKHRTPIEKLRSVSSLWSAWKKVKQNGLQASTETKTAIKDFERNDDEGIRSIASRIAAGSFVFKKAKGIELSRPGKDPRPIVMAPVENCIVQRALLDILQEEPALIPYVETPTSFGGIRGRSVSHAIAALIDAQKEGAKYFIRSDIKSFFRYIPKESVHKTIADCIRDESFLKVLRDAMETEFANVLSIKHIDLFPTHEIGVAQGCCLSPLFGNILLHDFDRNLNRRGIVCLRFIDDFIVLGKNKSAVEKAFCNGLALLQVHGLEAHKPAPHSAKANYGYLANGVDFLGCSIMPNIVRPNRRSIIKFHDEVVRILDEGILGFKKPALGKTFRTTLDNLHFYLQGWGNQYNFCTDKRLFHDLDRIVNTELHKLIKAFSLSYEKKIRGGCNCQETLGLHCVAWGKQDIQP